MALLLLLSTNCLSSWKVDMCQNHDAAEIPSQPWRKMTFPPMRPRRNCNAIDEDGRAWYDDSNLAMFIRLSTRVAPMAGVTALASLSYVRAHNDGLSHGLSDGLGSNPAAPVPRVTALAMAGVTALARVTALTMA
ncbi:hypothetical protein Pyn_14080 [Prunus yedoensis var. nudiflora]|uniref:Uncharacterized protein n=1 Tax=Prunus yedoensis var. nudiflora TaxID=2094558 RepID=A0A314Y078_PRUYE|nr:hypothetical protein Pyn_14080 [Prunus yedoensis var. nudiflora]